MKNFKDQVDILKTENSKFDSILESLSEESEKIEIFGKKIIETVSTGRLSPIEMKQILEYSHQCSKHDIIKSPFKTGDLGLVPTIN